jgi:hypothetical protein
MVLGAMAWVSAGNLCYPTMQRRTKWLLGWCTRTRWGLSPHWTPSPDEVIRPPLM